MPGGTDPIPGLPVQTVGDGLEDIIIASAGLDAFWKLDESAGSTAFDSGPNAYDLTRPSGYSSPTWGAVVAELPGARSAYFVDGTDDYLNRTLVGPSGDFTYVIWCRPRAIVATEHFLGGMSVPINSGGDGWALTIGGSSAVEPGKLRLHVNDGSGTNNTVYGNNALTMNGIAVYCLGFTRISGVFRLYVDGAVQANTLNTGYGISGNETIHMGEMGRGAGAEDSGYRMYGELSYAAYWGSRGLSGAEMLEIYESGVAGGFLASGLVWTSDGAGGASWAVPDVTQAELDAHVNDATDAHDASAISFSPTGSVAATDVQAAIAEVASEAGGGGSGALTLIADTELGSAAASIDFSSIPAAHKHLMLFLKGRTDGAGVTTESFLMRFNGDTGANYDWQYVRGSAATASAAESLAATGAFAGSIPGAAASASRAAVAQVTIPDYLDTTFHKAFTSVSAHIRGTASTNVLAQTLAGGWRSTAAINQITLFSSTGSNFLAGTRASLYGVS